jgi:hypothetical protein
VLFDVSFVACRLSFVVVFFVRTHTVSQSKDYC